MEVPGNPPISRLLRGVTAFEIVVLIITGGGLFFLPSQIAKLWPWTLLPFNSRFLGALYLSALVAALIMVVVGRWDPARVVTLMILVFTVIVLVVSAVYIERFERPFATVSWFVLYAVLPINAAYHLWLYRKLPPASLMAVRSWLQWFWLVYAVLVHGGGNEPMVKRQGPCLDRSNEKALPWCG